VLAFGIRTREGENRSTGGHASVDTAQYDAYGNILADIFANNGDPATSREESIGFGGQNGYFTDSDTPAGLICLGHRYYDTGTGRFINRDPIGYQGGANLYAFSGGNPVNEVDPSGTDWVDATSNFCAGAGDSLTFGGTHWLRLGVGDLVGCGDPNTVVDTSSGAYNAGVWTETGVEVVATCGSAGLKHLAERAIAKELAEAAADITRDDAQRIIRSRGLLNTFRGAPAR
jgi:RHS repeat-associated protein